MIGYYLPNNNENATVPILPKLLELNWASWNDKDRHGANFFLRNAEEFHDIFPIRLRQQPGWHDSGG